jgi:predicted DNA-binding transcriptional regulator AlpA
MDTRRYKVHADPVGSADIAKRLGLKRQTVAVWRRRHPDFPQPRWIVSGQPAWDWQDIVPWLERTGRGRMTDGEEETA